MIARDGWVPDDERLRRWYRRTRARLLDRKWRKQERRTDADLAAGRYREFDNANDAITWLTGD